MVYIYIDAYFSFELITFHFVHIFVLPDVPFAVVPPVVSSFVTFLSVMFLLHSLQYCISYCVRNSVLVFLSDIRCISMICIDIFICIFIYET